jgi:acyl-CoA reductase-like NAD-dependent aldehyde dehydrogenase
MDLKRRAKIIDSIRAKMFEHGDELARLAHEETGMGRYEDKVRKNRLVTEMTPGPEMLGPSAYTGDHGLSLIEPAPFGVIGTITPSTNPTSTIICNAIGMISAGNAVVFNVHPSAKDVSVYNVKLLNQAISEANGPANLVTTVAQPTIQSAQELMKHPGIRVLTVTGGAEVVKVAMQSGKRAICAGPGNPPVVVDETADIEHAAYCIVQGASLDNNIICIDEKEIFVVESVADQLIAALSRQAAIILKPHEIEQLEKVIFKEMRGNRQPAVMNRQFIGQDVQKILAEIGINVDASVRLAVAPVHVGHPLVWTEQMMPVIPLVRMPNVDQAIDVAKEAEHGFRHTAIMHSKNLDNLSRMARVMDCSIFVKNGPSTAGLGYGGEGYCSFTIASPTGEGLTGPHTFSRQRRCVLVDHFRIV